MFKKVLVANRGPILAHAVRAIKELGAKAAVIYLLSDKRTSAVWMADEAHEVSGESPAAAFYDYSSIAELAAKIGADAVHPGYGFIAQNSDFAKRLAERNIALISSDFEQSSGFTTHKPSAKRVAAKMKIPTIPGSDVCSNLQQVQEAAPQIGFPVIVKAVISSGGRGMRICRKASELEAAYQYVLARCDALHLPSRDVYVEKFLPSPKHIEFPVLRDRDGSIVVLPEVECSVQRRFQKLVMESPSSIPDKVLVKRLAGYARKLAEKLEITGLISLEFLVQDKQPFFLEANGYIQPAYTVTYELTGVNLLKEQIRLSSGEPLVFSQEDVSPRGSVIAVAVNAEDPGENFTPSPGVVKRCELPNSPGVVVHSTVGAGELITTFFEPVIAQVVAAGASRSEALTRLNTAVSSFIIEGVKSNLPFLGAILESADFKDGKMHTSYLTDKTKLNNLLKAMISEEEEDLAAVIAVLALVSDANAQPMLDAAQRDNSYSIWGFASRMLNRNSMGF